MRIPWNRLFHVLLYIFHLSLTFDTYVYFNVLFKREQNLSSFRFWYNILILKRFIKYIIHFFIIYSYIVLSDSEEIIDTQPGNVELVPCSICSRTFAPSTLEKHIGICEKMHVQKRTPFDSFRQRREGTGLETYLPSSYGSNTKPKTSRLSPTDSKSKSVWIIMYI